MAMAGNITIEFTIEPFIEGALGVHVTEAISAIEALGVSVDIGPFGSSLTVDSEIAGNVLSVLVRTAYANGATHITINTQKVL